MQDTKNLIKKRDIEYPKLILEAIADKNETAKIYWELQLERVKHKIDNRIKNRIKNKKQFKKAN